MSDNGPPAAARFTASRPRLPLIAIAAALVVLMFYLGEQAFVAGLFRSPWDKLAHFLTYAILTGLLRIGIGGDQPWLLVVLIGIIGGLDEWHQLTIPGRSAELADLATDVAAAVVAIMACEWHGKSRQPSLPAADHST